jgi:calcium-dependent protein kinase
MRTLKKSISDLGSDIFSIKMSPKHDNVKNSLYNDNIFECGDILEGFESNILNQSLTSKNNFPMGNNLVDTPECTIRRVKSSQEETSAFTPKNSSKLTLSAYRKPESTFRFTSACPDRVIDLDYDMRSQSRILGHGASSIVRLASHRQTGKMVAVKCIAKHDILRDYMLSGRRRHRLEECEILMSLRDSHSTIINLLDIYENDTEIQLVMEYCAGGELFDAILKRRRRTCDKKSSSHLCTSYETSDCTSKSFAKRKRNRSISFSSPQDIENPASSGFTEVQAARIAHQLLSALSHLHGRGIVHRDVKPENILLVSEDEEDFTVKLSDFGLARLLNMRQEAPYDDQHTPSPVTPPSRSRAYSRVGSDYYTAPEVVLGAGYDTAVDLYSLGVTLYVLLSGYPPTSRPRCGSFVLDHDMSSCSEDDESSIDEDLKPSFTPSFVDFPPSHWANISTSAKDLLRKMLHHDPVHRISATDALQHEWILNRSEMFDDSPFLFMKTLSCISFVPFPDFSTKYLSTKLFESSVNDSRSRKSKRPRIQRSKSEYRLRHEANTVEKSHQFQHMSMLDLYNRVNDVVVSSTVDFVEDSYECNGDINDDDSVNEDFVLSDGGNCFPNSMRPLSV